MTEKRLRIGINGDHEELHISVKDSGVGIRDSDKSKLFQLFGSIKSEKEQMNPKGVGLGLVICKQIVERFDGCIGFDSIYGLGTTFHYFFVLEKIVDS